MVKFLLEHALTLDEKTEEQGSPEMSLSGIEAPLTQAQKLSERGRFTTTAISDLLTEYVLEWTNRTMPATEIKANRR